MKAEIHKTILFVLTFVLIATGLTGQNLRDGKIFDPGYAMQTRSKGAHGELDKMAFLIGQWDVISKLFVNDSISHTAKGYAHVTYMNRGHAIMERFHCPDFDGKGNELNTMAFLTFSSTQKVWGLGEANSFTESITMLNGDFEGEHLVLHNAVRRLGGMILTYYRATYKKVSSDNIEFILETSTDADKSWKPAFIKSYRKRKESEQFMAAASELGSFAPGLPDEARQFDFLIGVYDAPQDLTFPNGQNVKFPSVTTAVYTLNGHAILEFGWYDVDPNLPDAATSIIRIYNRAMRRWESLYMTNRGNSLLYFGGRKEGDRIVLNLFETHTADPNMSRFVFHSVQKDSYQWFAESSQDRGKTFKKTWIIEATRNK